MNNFNEAAQSKSNTELLKMVYEFDEWSPEILNAVEQELLNRKILPTDLVLYKQNKIEMEDTELSKGKEAGLTGQIIGWLTVFGILGFAIGYNYAFSKVRSKYSAKQYFKYNDDSRKNGKYLFYTSLFLSAIVILYKVITLEGTGI